MQLHGFIYESTFTTNNEKNATNQHFEGLLDYQSKYVETTIPKFHLFGTTTASEVLVVI